MNKAYIDWPVLVAVLAALGWAGYQFSRRTYRIAALAAVIASVVALTEYGAASSAASNFIDAFTAGSKDVIETMLNPLVAGTHSFPPGVVGWVVLLVLIVGVLVCFDTWSARREQPRVEVADPPAAEQGNSDLEDRRAITEELRFRLPAVYVRTPATMPGGLTLDNLATMVSGSEVKGGKVAAALMQIVHALEGKPRTYEARLYVESCTPDGELTEKGSHRRLTVDLQNARTGQAIAVQMLPACLRKNGAEQAAGFAARQVFRDDPSTPCWAVGSRDGQDLAAYLLSREICAEGRAPEQLYASRQLRRHVLEQAVKDSPAPGLVGYDLAAMYDLDGEYLNSLKLHLRNRVHYPRFRAGRYRLAITLSALAGLDFGIQRQEREPADGAAPGEVHEVRAEIARSLEQSGLLNRLTPDERAALRGNPWAENKDRVAVNRALLHLAKQELSACQRAEGTISILWNAFFHRRERASLLPLLRDNMRWLHPRRRKLASSFAMAIVQQRLALLELEESAANDSLREAREKAMRSLAVAKGEAGLAERVPWQAVYNAACLFAVAAPGQVPSDENAYQAVRLLRLAIDDPACDLERPSEWIAMDPDLRSLRTYIGFSDFIKEQAAKDFAPSRPIHIGDKWFRAQLPKAKSWLAREVDKYVA
jgi:hypothetical protein